MTFKLIACSLLIVLSVSISWAQEELTTFDALKFVIDSIKISHKGNNGIILLTHRPKLDSIHACTPLKYHPKELTEDVALIMRLDEFTQNHSWASESQMIWLSASNPTKVYELIFHQMSSYLRSQNENHTKQSLCDNSAFVCARYLVRTT